MVFWASALTSDILDTGFAVSIKVRARRLEEPLRRLYRARYMSVLDKLERRLGFIAIPGLLRYIAILTALVFVLYKVDHSYLRLIDLDPSSIGRGQVWRLVTYLFIPQLTSLLPLPDWVNAAFYVLFLWWMGNGLESVWGPFRLTLFYLIG